MSVLPQRKYKRENRRLAEAVQEKKESERLQSAADSALSKEAPRRRNRRRRNRAKRGIRPQIPSNTFVQPPNPVNVAARSARSDFKQPSRAFDRAVNGADLSGKYMKMLVAPQDCQTYIPDSQIVKRCLLFSKQEYPISANVTDGGRFSFAVQPILGSTGSDPSTYKVALTKPSLGSWEGPNPGINWSSADTYQISADNAPVSSDQYAQFMTSPPVFTTIVDSAGGTTLDNCLGTNPSVTDASSIPQVGELIQGSPSTISLPAGAYLLSLRITGTVITTAPQLTATVGSITEIAQDNVISADGELAFRSATYVSTTPFTAKVTAAATTVTACTMSISPTWWSLAGSTGYMNGGAIVTMRPAAQSVLYTSAISEAYDGGFVSGSRVTGSALEQGFFTQAAANVAGQLQYYEKLCQTALGEKYKHREGCYLWWAAEDPGDYNFRTPNEAIQYPYPALVVSGQCVPSGGVSGEVQVGTAVVTTVWEFTTNITMFQSEYCFGTTQIVESVRNQLAQFPAVVENPEHENFIRKVYNSVVPWVKRLAPAVLPTLLAAL